MTKNPVKKNLIITAAIAATFASGYGTRRAYAGSCTGSNGSITCSGAAGADTSQSFSSASILSVSTNPGFGITTAAGNAFELTGLAGVSGVNFIDSNTSAITGASTGIFARNLGNGATSITTTGNVIGSTNDGINAFNESTTSNLSISTTAVSGGRGGVFAQNNGSGATSITSTGLVTGGSNGGISASNGSTGTDITISAVDVSGGKYGINAINFGAGATSITSTGLVMGGSYDGIYASNQSTATSLTISAVDVYGAYNAISAFNFGSGATSITSTGLVTGGSDGIVARNVYATSTNLTISAVDVSGGTYGINARNYGAGATSVTSTGLVTGGSSSGISAHNVYATSTNLTISAVDVSGGTNGINARNYGSGATSITSTGLVTGVGGISARNQSTGTDLTISAVDISGGNYGIYAGNNGSGATSITSTGLVTGGFYSGIVARNLGTASTNLTISAVDVSGGTFGIYAQNYGSGATNITVTGDVTGGAKGAGIYSLESNGNGNTITLNSGASVSATSGNAIQMIGGGSNGVIVNSGASVTGSVDLGGITNSMTLNSGTLNVANGFALNIQGNLINANGVVSLRNNTIDTPATISGNFTGGGQLLVDANFATNTADKLNINGSVLAGGTSVGVNDISTGPANGVAITLVTVAGATTNGDFVLAAPVVSGAFNYNNLTRVGNDWVLQSEAAGQNPTPAFTPFAASFEALSQSLLTMATLPSLISRINGRIVGSELGANSGDETTNETPIWLRFAGGYRDIDSNRSTTGANFDINQWLAQLGIDFTVADNANGRFVASVNAGYNKANTDVLSNAGKSNIDTIGRSIGLSGTWYGVNGVYVDTQLQRSWYDIDLSAGGVGTGKVNGVDGDGYSASIEVGKEIALNDTLNIVPQAQLVFANVDSDKFTGANSEVVKLYTSKSLRARLGATLNKLLKPGGATHGFILANVIREFEDETQVNVSATQLTNAVDRWTGELGVGINHTWAKGTTVYELNAAVSGSSSLNNFGDSKAAQGQVNFKINF